jgi:uncharacterized repeat protein (TIGR03803 family)
VGHLTLIGSTLYGITQAGGANNVGAVYSVPTTGGDVTVLASLPYGDYLVAPWYAPHAIAGLTLSGSTLYGTTSIGGAHEKGVVFSMTIDQSPFPTPSFVVLLVLILALVFVGIVITMKGAKTRGKIQH